MSKRECHDYEQPVFIEKNLFIYGGSWKEIKYEDYDVVICLLETTPKIFKKKTIKGTGIFKNLNNTNYKRKDLKTSILHLPIEDMSAPEYNTQLWCDILGILRTEASEKEGRFKVAVHCMGGHGRTGTVLVILGSLLKLLPDTLEEAIKELRDRYCQKAVESVSQLIYITKTCEELGTMVKTKNEKNYRKLAYKSYSNSYREYYHSQSSKNYYTRDITGDIFYEETDKDIEDQWCEMCINYKNCPHLPNEYDSPEDFNCGSFAIEVDKP